MFITFGTAHEVGDYNLGNHFMRIREKQIPEVIKKNDNGFYAFAFRYQDEMLESMVEKYKMVEITPWEYGVLAINEL